MTQYMYHVEDNLSYRNMARRRQTTPSFVFIFIISLVVLKIAAVESFSASTQHYAFNTFKFNDVTGICTCPSSFYCIDAQSDEKDFFVLRNVPGDGDCVFHAVLSSVFISMGMLSPDSEYDTIKSMSRQLRNVVANFLSSPEGTLYVN